MSRVLVSDPISRAGIDALKEKAGVDVLTDLEPDELLRVIPDYDALVVRSATEVTASVIRAGKKLKVIGRAGVGFNNIDVAEATARGVLVVNVPGGNTVSAAEHTLALMLSLARHVPQADRSLREGRWDRGSFTGVELRGKVLGLLGYGRIGREVARRARAFDMRVLVYDPYVSEKSAGEVELTDLPGLLKESDFISIHSPLTKETRGLIGQKEIAMMKPSARIVNCARGGIIDEEALYEALSSGRIAGAALDVFEKEPPGESPLFRLPNTVVTPHLGASTVEAQELNGLIVAREVLKVLDGQPSLNAVNIPAVEDEEWAGIAPLLPLMEQMGGLLAQAFEGRLASIEVEMNQSLSPRAGRLLTSAALSGILNPVVQETVNLVNAEGIAAERHLSTKQTYSARKDVCLLGRFEDGRETSLTGNIFEGAGRVTGIAGYKVDLAPTEHMVVTFHRDVPGIIGKVGTILGDAGVNIAGMHVGRQGIGGQAVMILLVDEDVSEELMARIRSTPGMEAARKINLGGRQG